MSFNSLVRERREPNSLTRIAALHSPRPAHPSLFFKKNALDEKVQKVALIGKKREAPETTVEVSPDLKHHTLNFSFDQLSCSDLESFFSSPPTGFSFTHFLNDFTEHSCATLRAFFTFAPNAPCKEALSKIKTNAPPAQTKKVLSSLNERTLVLWAADPSLENIQIVIIIRALASSKLENEQNFLFCFIHALEPVKKEQYFQNACAYQMRALTKLMYQRAQVQDFVLINKYYSKFSAFLTDRGLRALIKSLYQESAFADAISTFNEELFLRASNILLKSKDLEELKIFGAKANPIQTNALFPYLFSHEHIQDYMFCFQHFCLFDEANKAFLSQNEELMFQVSSFFNYIMPDDFCDYTSDYVSIASFFNHLIDLMLPGSASFFFNTVSINFLCNAFNKLSFRQIKKLWPLLEEDLQKPLSLMIPHSVQLILIPHFSDEVLRYFALEKPKGPVMSYVNTFSLEQKKVLGEAIHSIVTSQSVEDFSIHLGPNNLMASYAYTLSYHADIQSSKAIAHAIVSCPNPYIPMQWVSILSFEQFYFLFEHIAINRPDLGHLIPVFLGKYKLLPLTYSQFLSRLSQAYKQSAESLSTYLPQLKVLQQNLNSLNSSLELYSFDPETITASTQETLYNIFVEAEKQYLTLLNSITPHCLLVEQIQRKDIKDLIHQDDPPLFTQSNADLDEILLLRREILTLYRHLLPEYNEKGEMTRTGILQLLDKSKFGMKKIETELTAVNVQRTKHLDYITLQESFTALGIPLEVIAKSSIDIDELVESEATSVKALKKLGIINIETFNQLYPAEN